MWDARKQLTTAATVVGKLRLHLLPSSSHSRFFLHCCTGSVPCGRGMVYPDSQARYFTGCWLTFPGDPDLFTTVSERDRKSTRLNSSHSQISYAVFCLKKKKK